jgi:hypothetical protein
MIEIISTAPITVASAGKPLRKIIEPGQLILYPPAPPCITCKV